MTKIAVAKVSEIYYDTGSHPDIMHIGCGYPGTDENVSACGHRDEAIFDKRPIDDTPDEFVCLGCIVATQHADAGVCWRTGYKCVCNPDPVEIAI